jgi:hypothetical protein
VLNPGARQATQSDYLRLLHSTFEALAGQVDEADSHLKSRITALASRRPIRSLNCARSCGR